MDGNWTPSAGLTSRVDQTACERQPLTGSPTAGANRPPSGSWMVGEDPKVDGPTDFWDGEAWAWGSGFPAGSGVQPRSV